MRSESRDSSLLFVVVRKVRHSTVSLHRVRLLFSLCPAFHVYSVYIMDESKVREIVAHNNKELLSQIKDLVSSSISDLKRSSDARPEIRPIFGRF